VIPVFNEATRLPAALRQVLEHLERRGGAYEVIVVDDGSTDGTPDCVEQQRANHSALHLLRHPANHGKGCAVRAGMLAARGDYVLFTDADLSAPLRELERILDPLRNGYDVVIGSRALKPEWISIHQPRPREAAGKMFNVVMRCITGLDFRDTQCGFKAFRRGAAQAIFWAQTIDRFGFDVEILYLARKFGLKALEVPVHWAHSEDTKVRPLRDGTRMLWDLLRIRWNDWMGKYESPR
jgi:glycosyltransferase involved in cell wall biosynthesis